MLLIELHKSKATGQITPELSSLLLAETNQIVRELKSNDPPSSVARAMANLHRGLLYSFDPQLIVNTQQAKLLVRTIVMNCV
jgi:hypothetical protein